jgi:hypothetical protein
VRKLFEPTLTLFGIRLLPAMSSPSDTTELSRDIHEDARTSLNVSDINVLDGRVKPGASGTKKHSWDASLDQERTVRPETRDPEVNGAGERPSRASKHELGPWKLPGNLQRPRPVTGFAADSEPGVLSGHAIYYFGQLALKRCHILAGNQAAFHA